MSSKNFDQNHRNTQSTYSNESANIIDPHLAELLSVVEGDQVFERASGMYQHQAHQLAVALIDPLNAPHARRIIKALAKLGFDQQLNPTRANVRNAIRDVLGHELGAFVLGEKGPLELP